MKMGVCNVFLVFVYRTRRVCQPTKLHRAPGANTFGAKRVCPQHLNQSNKLRKTRPLRIQDVQRLRTKTTPLLATRGKTEFQIKEITQ